MKGFLITLGAVALTAGIIYMLKDNETVKDALDKLNDTANDTMDKLSNNWKKASERFNQTVAEQA